MAYHPPVARVDSLFARAGGEPWFIALVDRFYERVEADPVLRPLYPEDLAPGRAHLAQFLSQYWGGPATYSEERGHPRLRQRHFPFAIDAHARDAWVGHMSAAVHAGGLSEADVNTMIEYFEMAATSLVNQPGSD
ncbi:MAG: hemoglobin [Chloroflexota bacterium]|nr:hemoglobin [Chloroflexota bacterium]